MTTPAAPAIVIIFNRIKSGSNAQGWAALGPPVIQSARRHALEQARDVIGWPRRALVGTGERLSARQNVRPFGADAGVKFIARARHDRKGVAPRPRLAGID